MTNESIRLCAEEELRQLRGSYRILYNAAIDIDMPSEKDYPNGLFGQRSEDILGLMEAIMQNVERLHLAFHNAP